MVMDTKITYIIPLQIAGSPTIDGKAMRVGHSICVEPNIPVTVTPAANCLFLVPEA